MKFNRFAVFPLYSKASSLKQQSDFHWIYSTVLILIRTGAGLGPQTETNLAFNFLRAALIDWLSLIQRMKTGRLPHFTMKKSL